MKKKEGKGGKRENKGQMMEDDGNTVMVQKQLKVGYKRHTFYKWRQNEKRVGIGHVLASVGTQFWRWGAMGREGKGVCARWDRGVP
jgi:hypothetical protein